MNQKGPVSAYARKKYKPCAAKASEAEAPNVLDREFDGHPPHTHIVGDLAYVRVGGKWNYVCLLIDPRDREIVGHAASGRKDSRLVKAAFATLGFPPTGIDVLRADCGSEFANSGIDGLPEAFDVRRSLSRKGDPRDDAAIEPASRTPKKELAYRRASADRRAPPRAQPMRPVAQRGEDAFDAGLHEPSWVQECRIAPVKTV